jgi:hypothetical protein
MCIQNIDGEAEHTPAYFCLSVLFLKLFLKDFNWENSLLFMQSKRGGRFAQRKVVEFDVQIGAQ